MLGLSMIREGEWRLRCVSLIMNFSCPGHGVTLLYTVKYVHLAEFIEPEHVDMCGQQSGEEKGEVCILLDL